MTVWERYIFPWLSEQGCVWFSLATAQAILPQWWPGEATHLPGSVSWGTQLPSAAILGEPPLGEVLRWGAHGFARPCFVLGCRAGGMSNGCPHGKQRPLPMLLPHTAPKTCLWEEVYRTRFDLLSFILPFWFHFHLPLQGVVVVVVGRSQDKTEVHTSTNRLPKDELAMPPILDR